MGKTLVKTLMEIRERIRHAMNGELPQGEDENGTVYRSASREECDKYILAAYDKAVYHCLEANMMDISLGRSSLALCLALRASKSDDLGKL